MTATTDRTTPDAASRALVAALASGEVQSGEALGVMLGCSRAAVWKRIVALRESGLGINAVPGQGYRLEHAVDLLDAGRISAGLDEPARAAVSALETAWWVDSTNSELLRRPHHARNGRVVLAEGQRAGRGRRGRPWLSPLAANLYLSLGWRFDGGAATLAEWPLAVAIACCRALARLGFDRRVPAWGCKWPNDLLVDGRKLGGCLVELEGDASGPCLAVVGIGINVHLADRVAAGMPPPDQPWAELAEWLPAMSRNDLAAALVTELVSAAKDFADEGFAPFAAEWSARDLLRGHAVRVHDQDRVIEGRALGLGRRGALRVETGAGPHDFHAADVSIRHG